MHIVTKLKHAKLAQTHAEKKQTAAQAIGSSLWSLRHLIRPHFHSS